MLGELIFNEQLLIYLLVSCGTAIISLFLVRRFGIDISGFYIEPTSKAITPAESKNIGEDWAIMSYKNKSNGDIELILYSTITGRKLLIILPQNH
jgi:hypothetical protein